MADAGLDEDEISLTSTLEDQGNEDDYYEVDCILEEENKMTGGGKYYFIKWTGYPPSQWTWEPEANVEDPTIVEEWEKQKLRISKGEAEKFDREWYDSEVAAEKAAKKERQERRRAKRLRLAVLAAQTRPQRKKRTMQKVDTFIASLRDNSSSDEARESNDVPEDAPSPSSNRRSSSQGRKEIPAADQGRQMADTTRDGSSIRAQAEDPEHNSFTSLEKPSTISSDPASQNQGAEVAEKGFEATFTTTASTGVLGTSLQVSEPEKSQMKTLPTSEKPSTTGYSGTANRALNRHIGGTAASEQVVRGSARGGGKTGSTPPVMTTTKAKATTTSMNTKTSERKTGHYKNFSSLGRAELAGRNLADREPDIPDYSSLIVPGEYRGPQPIRKRVKFNLPPSPDKSNSGLLQEDNSPFLPIESNEPQPPDPCTRSTAVEKDIVKTVSTAEDVAKHDEEEKKTFYKERIKRLGPENDAMRQNIAAQQNQSGRIEPLRAPAALHMSQPSGSRPKQKLSISSYNAQRSAQLSYADSLKVKISFGIEDLPGTKVGLTNTERSDQSWMDNSHICCNEICLAKNFASQIHRLRRNVVCEGSIITLDAEALRKLEAVAEYLRLLTAAVLSRRKKFTILIFPAKVPDWSFIDTPNTSLGVLDAALLRYQVFENEDDSSSSATLSEDLTSLQTQTIHQVGILQTPYLTSLMDLTFNLKYASLLPPETRNRDNFFFLFPDIANDLFEYLQNWLYANNPDCRIFSSIRQGAWTAFTAKIYHDGGVILVHESVVQLLPKLPGLYQILLPLSPFHCQIWEVTEDANTGVGLSRLFPHGIAVLLTPSFLESEPKRVVEVVKRVSDQSTKYGTNSHKLVGCFELRSYLLDQAIMYGNRREELLASYPGDEAAKEAEATRQGLSWRECDARFRSFNLVMKILEKERRMGYCDFRDESKPDGYWSSIVYAPKEIGCGSGVEDEKRLVEWFAFWALTQRGLFKTFQVIGSQPKLNGLEMAKVERRDSVGTPYSGNIPTDMTDGDGDVEMEDVRYDADGDGLPGEKNESHNNDENDQEGEATSTRKGPANVDQALDSADITRQTQDSPSDDGSKSMNLDMESPASSRIQTPVNSHHLILKPNLQNIPKRSVERHFDPIILPWAASPRKNTMEKGTQLVPAESRTSSSHEPPIFNPLGSKDQPTPPGQATETTNSTSCTTAKDLAPDIPSSSPSTTTNPAPCVSAPPKEPQTQQPPPPPLLVPVPVPAPPPPPPPPPPSTKTTTTTTTTTTVDWYTTLKSTGQTWEHIAVHGWERAFGHIGLKRNDPGAASRSHSVSTAGSSRPAAAAAATTERSAGGTVSTVGVVEATFPCRPWATTGSASGGR